MSRSGLVKPEHWLYAELGAKVFEDSLPPDFFANAGIWGAGMLAKLDVCDQVSLRRVIQECPALAQELPAIHADGRLVNPAKAPQPFGAAAAAAPQPVAARARIHI